MRVEERSSDQGAISGCPGREGVVGQKPDSKGYMQVGDAADTQSAKKFGSWEGKEGWANSVGESQDRRVFQLLFVWFLAGET